FNLAEPGAAVSPEAFEPFLFDAGALLVIVDGYFRPELSQFDLPGGVIAAGLADALDRHADLVREHLGQHAGFEHDAFTALNAAYLRDGAFVHIGRGVRLD